MREHPIPQDVVGYRFHIVGNMTIKQFAEIAAGCVIGFGIYSTNLAEVIKWPLIALTVAIGAMAAFVPFEERSLDHWLVTFVRAMYKPTQFFWRREPKIPDYFLYKKLDSTTTVSGLDLKPVRRQRVQEFFGTLEATTALDPFAVAEQSRLTEIMSAFQSVQVTQIDIQPQAQKPNLIVSAHSLRSRPQAEAEVQLEEVVQPAPTISTDAQYFSPSAQQVILNVQPGLSTQQVATDIQIPELPSVTVDSPSGVAWSTQTDPTLPAETDHAYSTLVSATTPVAAVGQAVSNANLPFPVRPDQPNKLVGMVLTQNNDLINEAIVEIIDQAGMVVRAVKTNALGQFFVATPLASGTYTISAEKDGFEFSPQSFTLTGVIVDPLEIRSRT